MQEFTATSAANVWNIKYRISNRLLLGSRNIFDFLWGLGRMFIVHEPKIQGNRLPNKFRARVSIRLACYIQPELPEIWGFFNCNSSGLLVFLQRSQLH